MKKKVREGIGLAMHETTNGEHGRGAVRLANVQGADEMTGVRGAK